MGRNGKSAPDDVGGVRHLGYIPALNGIRGAAVILVVAGHTLTNVLPDHSTDRVHSPIPGASLGVDMFFALSGFLITALLLNERGDTGTIKFGSFYIRRALRLLPALVAVLVVTTVYAAVANQGASAQYSDVLPVLFYFGNWLLALGWPVSPLLSHTWSLAIEEQFYLVWPFVVGLSFRAKDKLALVWIIFGLLIVSALYRIVTWNDTLRLLYYVNTLWRADPLIIGALGAFLWTRGLIPDRLGILPWASVSFLVLCVLFEQVGGAFYFLGGFALIGVATTVIIVAAVEGDWRGARVLAWRPLQAVGLVSYGIYLWHLPVFIAVQQQMPNQYPAERVVVAYVITTALVLASWFCVERPFLALKPGRSVMPHLGAAPVST